MATTGPSGARFSGRCSGRFSGRFSGRLLGAFEDAPRGCGDGRLEPLAGERDRIRQEPGQLEQVVRPAVRKVGVRLGDDAGGHGRQLHELGVGRHLTAEHDHRHPARRDRVQAVFPGLPPAEDADDDGGRAVQQRRQVLDREAGWVAQPVAGAAGPGRQQVGVRGGEQDDHAGSCLRSAGNAQRPGPLPGPPILDRVVPAAASSSEDLQKHRSRATHRPRSAIQK